MIWELSWSNYCFLFLCELELNLDIFGLCAFLAYMSINFKLLSSFGFAEFFVLICSCSCVLVIVLSSSIVVNLVVKKGSLYLELLGMELDP